MVRWLAKLLRRDLDPTWKPTGYVYTTERTYDYEAAVRGARKARRQTARGARLQRAAKPTASRKAEIWVFPKTTAK